MAQSLSKILLHVVFSTKNRERWLDDAIRPATHAYLAGALRAVGSEAFRVGGTDDHVHIACTLPRTLTVCKLLEEIKKHSSRWMKEIDPKYAGFAWQRGYEAFSIGRSQLDTVIQYVENQEEHHRKLTFQEEYRRFLAKYEVKFDERYVWD